MTETAKFESTNTKALVVVKPGAEFVLQDVICDHVGNHDVVVEIKYSGLCHTDIAVQHGRIPFGRYPAILGHEGVGIVRYVGPDVKDKTLKASDTVLLSFTYCGTCAPCDSGNVASCTRFTEINFGGAPMIAGSSSVLSAEGHAMRSQFFGQSSFSNLTIVSEKSVVKCDLSDEELCFMAPLGCGYQTGAGTVLNVLKPTSSTSVAVIGVGSVGSAAVMAAKVSGAKTIIVIDCLSSKLETAMSVGATHVIDSSKTPDLTEAIKIIAEEGLDRVVDTTGVPSLIEASISSMGQQGVVALLGVPPPGSKVTVDPWVVMSKCISIVGVVEGGSVPSKLIPKLIALQRDGKFPIEKLARRYPIAMINEAIHDMHSGRVIKPILSWDAVPEWNSR